MSKELTNAQIFELANAHGYSYRVLKAIIQVESGQHGFSEKTGKIIIQFEPTWFKRFESEWRTDTKNTTWQSNQVGDQTAEWKAFNSAYASDADSAMKSTSIGMMQLMGFHYASVGFKTVGEMWDFAKVSEYNQVALALRWIKTVPGLVRAIKKLDFKKIAYYYNGSGYAKYNYDTRIAAAYRLTREYSLNIAA